jgi:prephenate dehydrogenase
VVTDAGSTKSDVVAAARRALGGKVAQFVPGHPIAGRETNGHAAIDDLYVGKGGHHRAAGKRRGGCRARGAHGAPAPSSTA